MLENSPENSLEHSPEPTWLPLAPGVFARRYAELDQTIGLVVGTRSCLLVDSGPDPVHGAELASAVRARTPLPWTLAITHAHFDHFFATAALLPCPVWAHRRCATAIRTDGDAQRADWVARYRSDGRPELADRLAAATLVTPTELFTDRVELDLGDRAVELIHPGRGHTDHDVVVHVPDAGVLFAGDLVEQGAPPHVGEDTWLPDWPATLDTLLALRPVVVVPGHGAPVGPEFVGTQRDELRGLARLCARVRTGELSVDDAVGAAPYPAEYVRPVLERARPAR